MSEVKKSLQENMEYIRSQLPDDLKDTAEQCLDNCEVKFDDDDMAKQQILHQLTDEVKEKIDTDSILPSLETQPSLEEQKAMVLEALPDEFKADFEKNAENELVG